MSASGLEVFDKTVQTTNIWLKEISAEIGPDRRLAWPVLGVCLRALRDRTPANHRRQRGQDQQALGSSRGGFSTKIHLKTDFDSQPIAFDLTGGEQADAPQFETLMDLGPDITPRATVADQGYDSKANREAARKRGAVPVISYRSNIKQIPKAFAKALYHGRARRPTSSCAEHGPSIQNASSSIQLTTRWD